MSRRNLAVFGAAAVAAVAVAAPVLAQSSGGGQTITFHELNKGSRFDYIDNPPRNSGHRPPVFSVGDQFALANPLADDSGSIGELRAVCTFTKKALARNNVNPGHPFCSGAFVLKSGTLFVETADAGGKTTRGAVVGGTDAYVGARGTFTSTSTKSGADDVVNLLP
jgi:hypothetical protein